MSSRGGSIDPAKFPDEIFDLYSIPAFDVGQPDVLAGDAIGSTKQIVEPGDVLVSKIVPHIRRSWVVQGARARRQIASGEWIVFRGPRLHPPYLRQVLISDLFHRQFMNTTAGVGGSLIRARPSFVAGIQIPLPPLSEQRRIAEVLDRADALCTKRREALALLDELTLSIFLDMFGDPIQNIRQWPLRPLADLCSIAGEYGAGVSSQPLQPGLPRYIRITDIDNRGVLSSEPVSPSGPASVWDRYELEAGDVLFARSGATVGKTYRHSAAAGWSVFAGYLIRFRPAPLLLDSTFLLGFTRTAAYKSWVAVRQRVVAQPNINAQQYGYELLIPTPPINQQAEFAARISAIELSASIAVEYGSELDELRASLQYRAFAGDL